jgi:hypothetical protein
MSRIIRLLAMYALAVAGVAGLVFLSACNITSSTGGGGTARLNVLLTDAPSDDWSQVIVQVTSVSLRNKDSQSWVSAWTGTQDVNLVDMAGVSTILSSTSIPAGTYDRLKLTINPDTSTMKLVDSNEPPKTYSATDITVVDPSGKGEIKIDIIPAVTLPNADVGTLQLDIDLAHPLSIIVQNGKVIINLQVRHKAIPRNLRDIQFARSLGHITAVDSASTPNTFSMHTLEGADLKFDMSTTTNYVDVDNNKEGNFGDLVSLVTSDYTSLKGALVASNMNSDGTLHASQVWYGTITELPKFTPEGLVRRVGDNWIKVLNKNADDTDGEHMSCHWDSDIIYIESATQWSFHGTLIEGMDGLAMLKNIRRGFRVVVTLKNADATPRVAASINIQSAHDEGAIRSVSATGFTFGGSHYCDGWNHQSGPYGGRYYTHEWTYSETFSWWFFGQSPADHTATSAQDFMDTVNQAKAAHLRVFAWAELSWNTTKSQWVAENVVLAPEKLPEPTRVTKTYAPPVLPAVSGSMDVVTFDWDDETLPTPMTVYLDSIGDLQTLVGSFLWNSTTRILTFKVPVPSTQWESLLTPSLLGVRVWVRPVKENDTFTWHAYTVIAFQIVN